MIDSYEWGNAGILGCRHFLYKFNTLILQFIKKIIDKSYKQLCLLLFSISLIV